MTKTRPEAVAINRAALQQPVKPALDPENLPIKTLLWRVLIEVIEPRSRTEGGIELPESVKDAESTLTCMGTVLELGTFAYQSKTSAGLNLADEIHKPKVGDVVLFETYAGQVVSLVSGRTLKLLNETEILAIVRDKSQIRSYL
jgi:co-chaperonin GroES (HSP10)